MSLYVAIKKRLPGFTLDVKFEAATLPLGILGASGSGKSMTLKCIAGIVTPDEGRIAVDGHVLYDSEKRINLKPQRRRTGYLLQNHALFPNMTVEKNIAEAIAAPTAEKGKRIDRLLEKFELQGLGQRYPAQLSGGQQQRVAVARVLASEPDVLLLDEPFSALDTYLKESLQLDMMVRLAEFSGYSVLVTHDRNEVYQLCPDLLMLRNGCVEAQGSTAALFRQPRSLESARLTGCKNISPAIKKGSYSIYATDWDLVLDTSEPVPDNVAFVGIRSQAFYPVSVLDEKNSFRYVQSRCIESPFERMLQVDPVEAKATHPLWWRSAKSIGAAEKQGILAVNPLDVLPLTNSECCEGIDKAE